MTIDLSVAGVVKAGQPFKIAITTSSAEDVLVTLEHVSGTTTTVRDFALSWPGHNEPADKEHTVVVDGTVTAKVKNWGTAAIDDRVKVTASVEGEDSVTVEATVLA